MVLATKSGRRVVSEARERLHFDRERPFTRKEARKGIGGPSERHELPLGASDCARWYQTRENWDSKRGTGSRQGDVRDRDRLTHRR